jgi:hypothetical protein
MHLDDDANEIPRATLEDLHYNGRQHGYAKPSAGKGRFSLPNPALQSLVSSASGKRES